MEGLTFEELQNQKKEVADFIVSIMNRSSEDLQTMRLIIKLRKEESYVRVNKDSTR